MKDKYEIRSDSFTKNFCKRYIQCIEEAYEAWNPECDKKRKREFFDWINRETGINFYSTYQKWKRLKVVDIQLSKPFRIYLFLRINDLIQYPNRFEKIFQETTPLSEIFYELSDYLVENIPPKALEASKKIILDQISQQRKNVYANLWRELEYFETLIREAIERDSIRLLDIISIMFTWYTASFFEDRAILLVESTYWNSYPKEFRVTKSRATEEFKVKVDEDEDETKRVQTSQIDAIWLLKELANKDKNPINETSLPNFIDRIVKSADIPDLADKAKEIWIDYLSNRRSWPELYKSIKRQDHRYSYQVILEILDEFFLHSEWGQNKDFRSDKESLANLVISTHKAKATNNFNGEGFLATPLDEGVENTDENKTDESGCGFPLLSTDRKSVVGAILVVSSNVNAFTQKKLTEYEEPKIKDIDKEYAIIQKISQLTETCLHAIYRSNLQSYNYTRILDPNQYFPEIVFDVWSTNYILFKDDNPSKRKDLLERDEKNPYKILKNALELCQKKLKETGFKSHRLSLDMTFNLAIGSLRSSIDDRLGAAINLCFRKIKEKEKDKNRLEEKDSESTAFFQLRTEIEKNCVSYISKNVVNQERKITAKIFNDLFTQAEGIQEIIDCLESVRFNDELNDQENDFESRIKHGLSKIRLARNSSHVENSYLQLIQSTVELYKQSVKKKNEAPSPKKSTKQIKEKAVKIEEEEQELCKLIYRFHIHFHVTISMFACLELTPYMLLFLIHASWTSMGNDDSFHSIIPSREAVNESSVQHHEILNEINIIINKKIDKTKKLEDLISDHLSVVENRIEKKEATIVSVKQTVME